jgi:DNA ligase (NAD+)
MEEKDITPITGGTRSAEKIVKSVQSKKEIPLATFIGGLDFEGGFGETLTQKVIDAGFDTLEKLQKASVTELSSINGIGEITAKALKKGLKENSTEIKNLLKVGVTITAPVAPIVGGKFEGKSFQFTGALCIKRAAAEKIVLDLGGKIASVSKNLTYLVSDDVGSGSAKANKALELGVKVIDGKTFLAMTK